MAARIISHHLSRPLSSVGEVFYLPVHIAASHWDYSHSFGSPSVLFCVAVDGTQH